MPELTKDTRPEEVREEWVRRLESGDYEQERGTLCRQGVTGGESFCCLGVLTEMASEVGLITKMARVAPSGKRGYLEDDGTPEVSELPRVVAEWAGLDGPDPFTTVANPKITDRSEAPYHTLASMNDNDYGFPEIADQIKKDFL